MTPEIPRNRPNILSASDLRNTKVDPGVREADPAGWINMIVVTQGQLTVTLGQKHFVVASGDFRVFSTDCPHRYSNETAEPLHFIHNVVY